MIKKNIKTGPEKKCILRKETFLVGRVGSNAASRRSGRSKKISDIKLEESPMTGRKRTK